MFNIPLSKNSILFNIFSKRSNIFLFFISMKSFICSVLKKVKIYFISASLLFGRFVNLQWDLSGINHLQTHEYCIIRLCVYIFYYISNNNLSYMKVYAKFCIWHMYKKNIDLNYSLIHYTYIFPGSKFEL